MEEWKHIKDYPHLLVSTEGRVWSLTLNRELIPQITNRGYIRINLSKDKKVKRVHLHRIVAETFIPNPDNLPAIDHIDGNKHNNKVENLQWISYSDNAKKAAREHTRIARSIVCIETGKVYKTIQAAAKELKIPNSVISAIVKGEYNSYHGLHFEYCEGDYSMGNYLTVKEYAEKHGVTESAVRQKIFRGVLPYKKVGEGTRSFNLIEENEPWENRKPGVKPGSRKSGLVLESDCIIIPHDYITTREYADLNGLSIETVRARCKRGTMPFIKVGDSIMIDRNYKWEKGQVGRPKKKDGDTE